MNLVCLDLEGVLVPEIWIAFSKATGIQDLSRTTRDEPDYDKLMNYRIEILAKHNLKLKDIQNVIENMEPLEGSQHFIHALRKKNQFIILSDTFEEFAKPLLAKLGYPTLFCNRLNISSEGFICGYRLRQQSGKKNAVTAFKALNMNIFAVGDSYNDLDMIMESHSGCLFRPPEIIKKDYPHLSCVETYQELFENINKFNLVYGISAGQAN